MQVRIYLSDRYIALVPVFVCPIMLDGHVVKVLRRSRRA
jgi:hypothetical protein